MQSFKTIIIDRFKMFHGVKVHFNVEGMCLYMGQNFEMYYIFGYSSGWNCLFLYFGLPSLVFKNVFTFLPPYYNNLITL